jgi:LPS-assembly protein
VQVAPTDTSLHSGASGRIFPQAALIWRYPWVRHDPGTSEVIEPEVAFVAAPNGGNRGIIPNEDSQGFEFDETSLFRLNRLPGYDLVDSGQRTDYGLNMGIYNADYGSSNMVVGQSYRLEQQSAFQSGSGLEHRFSDVVGRFQISPINAFDLFYRYRLDHADLAMKRQEAGLSAGPANLRGSISFISIKPVPGLAPIATGDQIGVSLSAELTRYWSARLHDLRDVGGGGLTVYSGVDLTYRDDCFSVTTSLQQSGISIGDVHPGISVLVTLVFKNLGEVSLRPVSTQE